jgi:hypothetical protein
MKPGCTKGIGGPVANSTTGGVYDGVLTIVAATGGGVYDGVLTTVSGATYGAVVGNAVMVPTMPGVGIAVGNTCGRGVRPG